MLVLALCLVEFFTAACPQRTACARHAPDGEVAAFLELSPALDVRRRANRVLVVADRRQRGQAVASACTRSRAGVASRLRRVERNRRIPFTAAGSCNVNAQQPAIHYATFTVVQLTVNVL